MKIKNHGEKFDIELDEGETVSITIGAITKQWTVETGKVGKFNTSFYESEAPEVTP